MLQYTEQERTLLLDNKVIRMFDRSKEYEAKALELLDEVRNTQEMISLTDASEYPDIAITLNNLLGTYIEKYYRMRIYLYTERFLNMGFGNHSKSVFAMSQKNSLTAIETAMFTFFHSMWDKDFAPKFYDSPTTRIGYHANVRRLASYSDLSRVFTDRTTTYTIIDGKKVFTLNEAGNFIKKTFGVDTVAGIVAVVAGIADVQIYWSEWITDYFLLRGGEGYDMTGVNSAQAAYDQASRNLQVSNTTDAAKKLVQAQFTLAQKKQDFAFTLIKAFFTGHKDWNVIGELEESFDLHWKQISNGISEIQAQFIDTTIQAFLAGTESEYVHGNVPDAEIRVVTMDGFFSSISRSWNRFRETYVDPVGDFVESSVGKTFDASIGKIIPAKYYDKLKGLTSGSLQILAGKISGDNLNKVLNGVKVFVLVGNRLTDEMVRVALRVGPIQSLDKYSGGLITSAKNLNKVTIKVVDSNGKARIDWRRTAFDALKVGMALAGGIGAVMLATGTNLVGEKTGLSDTEWGNAVLGVGGAYLTGNVPLDTIAKQEAMAFAQNEGVKTLIKNTALGKSSLGRTALELGVKSTMATIDSNQGFDEIIKENAKNKAQEVAKNRVNELISLKSKGLLDVDRLQKLYNLKDKSLEQMIADGQEEYKEAVKKIADRANEAYIKEKLQAEMDRKLVQGMDEAYGLGQKYGKDLLIHLIKKYGPHPDYDAYVVPEDFIDFQINVVDMSKPFTGVKYGSTKILIAGAIAAAVGAAIALS